MILWYQCFNYGFFCIPVYVWDCKDTTFFLYNIARFAYYNEKNLQPAM